MSNEDMNDTTTHEHDEHDHDHNCGGCGTCDMCEEHGTEWCNPDTIELKGDIKESAPCPEPEKTPAEICCCHTKKPCPVHLKLSLKYDKAECDKHPCIASIPPNLGCIPISAGVGKWDGGVPHWMEACLKGCDLKVWQAKYPHRTRAIMSQGQSLLDLDTNPESTSNLQVIGSNYVPRQINIREFMALAVKMYETGMCLSGGVNPNELELGYVQAEDGSLMLGIISDGAAVGNGLALTTTTDANGNITGVSLPLPV